MLKSRFLIFLGIFIFATACAPSTSNLSKLGVTAGQPRRCVLDAVPQYYQSGPNCGPVTLQMVLAYYGVKLPKKQIEEDVRTSNSGTSRIRLMEYPKSLGFKVEDKENGTINDVARNIANRRPVIVRQWLNPEAKLQQVAAHYRVVIGYDFDKRTIYLRDPNKSGLSTASFQEFNDLWDLNNIRRGSSKNWMLVIYK